MMLLASSMSNGRPWSDNRSHRCQVTNVDSERDTDVASKPWSAMHENCLSADDHIRNPCTLKRLSDADQMSLKCSHARLLPEKRYCLIRRRAFAGENGSMSFQVGTFPLRAWTFLRGQEGALAHAQVRFAPTILVLNHVDDTLPFSTSTVGSTHPDSWHTSHSSQ
jgi:hypothetical protein